MWNGNLNFLKCGTKKSRHYNEVRSNVILFCCDFRGTPCAPCYVSFCRLFSLTDIYIFGIGIEIFDDDLQPLTVGTGGRHYFRLKDIDNLEETFDKMIGKCNLKINIKQTEQSCLRVWLPCVFTDLRFKIQNMHEMF